MYELQSDTRSVYRIALPDKTEVTFHLLSFASYVSVFNVMTSFPKEVPDIENEIFRTCVLGPVLLKHNLEFAKAGTIGTVAGVIYLLSGPQNTQSTNTSLDYERQMLNSFGVQSILHICRAFPGYTPDNLLTMSWPQILNRLAMAEYLLIREGRLAEPLRALEPEEAAQLQKQSKTTSKAGGAEGLLNKGASINIDAETATLHREAAYNTFELDELELEKQKMIEQARTVLKVPGIPESPKEAKKKTKKKLSLAEKQRMKQNRK